jgi:hypothetical protein
MIRGFERSLELKRLESRKRRDEPGTSANQRTHISKIHRRYQRPCSLPPTSSRAKITPRKLPQKVHALLTSYYPYQRRKLSDSGAEKPRLQPRRSAAVRWSALLGVIIMTTF